MSAWTRMCSNGRGSVSVDIEQEKRLGKNLMESTAEYKRKRFVFFGGKDYQSTFGLKNTTSSPNTQIIGYMPDGLMTPHIIENDKTADYPIHVPAPEISRVEMTIQKEILRRATIEWTCFSWKQLEYMTPYFLVPGITCMVEMGWNHFNPESLVNIDDENEMISLWNNPYPLYEKNIINSNGNYDVIYGMITNFNWSVEGNNRYVCTTEITSKNRLYAGIQIDSDVIDRLNNGEDKIDTLGNLKEFINNDVIIDNFRILSHYGLDKFGDALQNKIEGLSDEKQEETLKEDNIQNVETYIDKRKTSFSDFVKSLSVDLNTELRKSYLHGVFDGRHEKENIPKEDFDYQDNPNNVWFNMGLLSVILNYFASRISMDDKHPMVELNIDESVIGAHRNLISSDSGVMLVPNSTAPKYFWGLPGQLNGDGEYDTQYVNTKGTTTKTDDLTPDDKILRRVFYQDNIIPPRDNHDKIINSNTYESANYNGSRSFPFESERYGYIRDIYFNIIEFRRLVEETDNFYDLINKMILELSNASAGFWDLKSVDSQKGYLTIVDMNYFGPGAFGVERNKVLTIDMHDANNYVKSFKFRPQLSDVQATRVLYGTVSNPSNKYYSVEERESMDYEYKDALIQTSGGTKGNSIADRKWKSIIDHQAILRDIQNINVENDTCQMTIDRFFDNKRKNTIDPTEDLDLTIQQFNQRRLAKKTNENKTIVVPDNLKKVGTTTPTEDIDASIALEYQKILAGRTKQKVDKIGDRIVAGSGSTINNLMDGRFNYIKLALPSSMGRSILRKMLDDEDIDYNQKYCAIQPNINAEITLQGIGGLRTFQCFLIKNLPRPYSEKNIVFQVINVMDSIEAGTWETTLVAGLRPLRKLIIEQLGIDQKIS